MSQNILSLKQFLLRQQVIKLYRQMLRQVREVPDEKNRKELLEWIRTDFKTNAHHTDEMTIKMLIKHGERSLKELQNTVNLSK